MIIIQDANGAQSALKTATNAGTVIDLASPPELSAAMGPSLFAERIAILKSAYPAALGNAWFYCGDKAGLAIATIRHGGVGIIIDLPNATAIKITEMAAEKGVNVIDAKEFFTRIMPAS
ncbi:MAG: hypothetical protein CBB68_10100 [Rhodospirillaceae bacterium TMED8]|nr:hypothetical protein [Magnetovibrio sp.]OUT50205.1 MAG: hypothetical protein CBB68_10100 [Rhodospirillaceae bacterium TMED8]|tara:strand:+ start:3904 stop:4260 length:357 start_codon:yes stop_codon:yes gene_type:complete